MIRPRSEAELCDAVKSTTSPLRIIGGGTRPIGNPVQGQVLSTAALTGIELYEPGALTLVAKAGTPLAEVEAALAAENQRLPFEPMDHRSLMGTSGEPTIGGVVAANVAGPRRIQAGGCRDSLIGVRFVDGQGTAIKNGGRVMKNVTGYDLVKLMAGSYGTLGVISEVGFKVLPGISANVTLSVDSDDPVATMSRALGSPFEVSAAAHDPKAGLTYLRLEGFDASVDYRATELGKLLGPVTRHVRDESEQIWRDIRDVTTLGAGDIWRVSVKPSDAPDVLAQIGTTDYLLDWGGGLIWAAVPPGTDLRATLDIEGHSTLIRSDEATKSKLGVFHPEPAPIEAINKGLRAKFDPRRILNPGLME